MKLLSLLSLVVLLSFKVQGQNFTIEYQNCYGGSETEGAYDMIEISDGYLIAGYTNSNDGDISFNHGADDSWLVKTDSFGDKIFEKTYGGTKGEGVFRIFRAEGNNCYLLCSANSSDGDIHNDPYTNSLDYWIIKIDSLGNIIWEKIVGGNSDDQITTGTPTTDGGVIAIGYSNSDDGDISIHYGMYDMWMVKLNSSGSIEWDFTLGNNYIDYPDAIIQTADGGFLVGGSSKITEGGNINCESHGQADGILVKLDSLRNIEWQQCYGGSDYDGITGMLETENGYIFTAYVNSNDGDITGWHGENDFWVVSIDKSGNIIWQNSLGGSSSEMGKTVIQTLDGGFFVIGETYSNDGDVSGNHSLDDTRSDIWIVKLSSEGELLSQQCIGGIGSESLEYGMIKKSDYNYVIAGQTNYGPSYDVDCNHNNGYPDYWLFEIKDTTVSVPENRQIAQWKVYPNPAKDNLFIEIPDTFKLNNALLQVLDANGRTLIEQKPVSKTTYLDIQKLQAGIYVLKMMNDEVFVTKRFVIR